MLADHGLLKRLEASDSDSTPAIQQAILLTGYIGGCIAGATTILRLVLRIRRLWWDDAFAALALLSFIITLVAGKLWSSLENGSTLSQNSRVSLYYALSVTFDTTVWLSRLSVLSTIIRLRAYTRRLYIASACFVIAPIVLIAQIFWVCEPQNQHGNHWKEGQVPQCVLGKSVAITQISTDAFADVVLVCFPLFLLRYLQSDQAKAEKLRLGVSFVVGGLTTLVSAVHAVYLFKATQISLLVSIVEMAVSVIISNFAVLAAAIHRLWKHYRPLTQEGTRISGLAFQGDDNSSTGGPEEGEHSVAPKLA